jgi:hypothetical protein
MKKIIWYSRYRPSKRQAACIGEKGWEIVGEEEGKELASRNLSEEDDAKAVARELVKLAVKHEAECIVGVFSVPMLQCLFNISKHEYDPCLEVRCIQCLSSWYDAHPVDGKRPKFVHKDFVQVGEIRWTEVKDDQGEVTVNID